MGVLNNPGLSCNEFASEEFLRAELLSTNTHSTSFDSNKYNKTEISEFPAKPAQPPSKNILLLIVNFGITMALFGLFVTLWYYFLKSSNEYGYGGLGINLFAMTLKQFGENFIFPPMEALSQRLKEYFGEFPAKPAEDKPQPSKNILLLIVSFGIIMVLFGLFVTMWYYLLKSSNEYGYGGIGIHLNAVMTLKQFGEKVIFPPMEGLSQRLKQYISQGL